MTFKPHYLGVFFALGLTMNLSIADDSDWHVTIEVPSQMVCKVIQDPQTKVIYYLESNRHHLSAISPQGTLLWQIDTWSDVWADFFKSLATPPLSGETLKGASLIKFIGLNQSSPGFPEAPVGLHLGNPVGLHLGNSDDYLSIAFNDGMVGLIKKSTGKITGLMRL